MSENRFAMRILDANGQCLWCDEDNVYAVCSVAIVDLQENGVDEVVVSRSDHGKTDTLVFVRDL